VSSDLKKILKSAERQGFTVRQTRNGHLQVLSADGKGMVTLSGTPSDHRALKNTLADLRRIGFDSTVK